MSIVSFEEFILSHIKVVEESSVDVNVKVKAVSGLRRIIFDLEYRDHVESYNYHDIMCHYDWKLAPLSCMRWTRTWEGYEFWYGLRILLDEHRRLHS